MTEEVIIAIKNIQAVLDNFKGTKIEHNILENSMNIIKSNLKIESIEELKTK